MLAIPPWGAQRLLASREAIRQSARTIEPILAIPRGEGLIAIHLTGLEAVRPEISIEADDPSGVEVLKHRRKAYSPPMKETAPKLLQ